MKQNRGAGGKRPFYVMFALLAVAGIGALSYVSTRNSAPAIAIVDTTLPPVQSEGYVMGSPDAPIEVIEFGDFECPACARFAEMVEPDVRAQLVNTGRIRFRYIDLPLPMHANAWNASRAAACADEQGKFWEMHDLLFATQDQWNSTATRNPDAKFKDLAGRIPGMDRREFNECVDSRRTQAKVQAHHAIAGLRQISGTPTFIAGDMSANYMSLEEFKRFVDAAIARLDSATNGATER